MHTHGFFRALAKPVWVHLRDWANDPAYRALHRFRRAVRHSRVDQPATVRFAGRPIVVGDGPSFLSAWDEIFVNRIYDVGATATLPRLVDGGANLGLAALYWKWRYTDFHYVGFEPDPQVAALCRRNLDAWGVTGGLRQAAVAPLDGTVTFASDGADGGHIVDGAAAGRPVEAVRLSAFLTEPVDLLKLDVEGAELGVLREAEPRLGRVRNLFVEVHSRPAQAPVLPDVLSLLQRAGFRVQVQIGFAAARPFSAPATSPSGFDSLVNVFATRR